MADDRCPECGGYRGLPRMLHDQEVPRECSHEFHKQADVVEFKLPTKEPEPKAIQPEAPLEAPSDQVQKRFPNPECPFCDATDGRFFMKMTDLANGQLTIAVACCQHCRKVWGITQVLQLQMMPPPGFPPGMRGS